MNKSSVLKETLFSTAFIPMAWLAKGDSQILVDILVYNLKKKKELIEC